MSWIWAALGGAVGASMRYGVSQWLTRTGATPLDSMVPATVVPTATGTLLVNLLGSLLMGLVVGFFDAKSISDERRRIFLVVGVLGGFTTMSALGIEGWQLLREGHTVKSLLLILGQCVGCVLLAATGWTLARTLWGTAGN